MPGPSVFHRSLGQAWPLLWKLLGGAQLASTTDESVPHVQSSIVPKGATGVDNTARKKWDAEEFAEQAKKRELEEDETADLTPYELKQLKRRRA